MKKNQLKPSEIYSKIEQLDIEPVLNSQIRQVKWLFNNSNKMTKVFDEKLVRLIVLKLQNRIKELESQLK